jgi:hypothetical protein
MARRDVASPLHGHVLDVEDLCAHPISVLTINKHNSCAGRVLPSVHESEWRLKFGAVVCDEPAKGGHRTWKNLGSKVSKLARATGLLCIGQRTKGLVHLLDKHAARDVGATDCVSVIMLVALLIRLGEKTDEVML